MDVPPLLGGSLVGREFVVAEWVEGALGFIRGEERLEAHAGAGVLVSRGNAHTFWNAAGARTRYLILMTPRIAALIEALHQPGAFEDIHGLFGRFDSELLA